MDRRSSRLFPVCLAVLAAFLLVLLCLLDSLDDREREAQYRQDEDLSVVVANNADIVEIVRDALRNRDLEIYLTFQTQKDHMEDVESLVENILDNAMLETGEPTEGDYIRWQYGGYKMTYGYQKEGDTYTYKVTVVPEYYDDAAQEREVDEQVEQIIKDLHFTRRTTDYEKVKAIHEYLCDTITYDLVHVNNPHYRKDSSAYAALINRQASCQGYSLAAYRLLRECGIPCRIITGEALNGKGEWEAHSWNLVELDGVYYNLDITWDQLSESEDYFLKADENFAEHVRDTAFSTEEFYTAYPMSASDW